jgi:hypothetical protein
MTTRCAETFWKPSFMGPWDPLSVPLAVLALLPVLILGPHDAKVQALEASVFLRLARMRNWITQSPFPRRKIITHIDGRGLFEDVKAWAPDCQNAPTRFDS